MKNIYLAILTAGVAVGLTACGKPHAHDGSDDHGHDHGAEGHPEQAAEATTTTPPSESAPVAPTDDHGHDHGDHGQDHGDHGHAAAGHDDHAPVEMNPVIIDQMTIRLAQGHGVLRAGQESHLVVKLPYSDAGASIVRAWIGTEDRTLSYVGKADYNSNGDIYDVHAMAPATLGEDAQWWIEIEKPDGSKSVGSAPPLVK